MSSYETHKGILKKVDTDNVRQYLFDLTNDKEFLNANYNVSELLKSQENELKGKTIYKVIENRKEAIKKAIEESKEGDVIFISGRGNKEVFCKSEYKIELFKDSDVVKEIIKGR